MTGRHKRRAIVSGTVGVIALLIALAFVRSPEKIALATVATGQVDRRVLLQGPVLPAEQATIAPRMPGRIARLYVREGQRIRKGDRIILIDASELAIDVERKEIAVRRARLRAPLAASGATDSLDPDRTVDRLDIRAAELELQRAKSMMDDSILRSPIDGVVIQIGVRERDLISPMRAGTGEGVIIAGTADFIVKGEIDEFEAGLIRAGMKAVVEFEAVKGAVSQGTVSANPVLRRFRPDGRQAAVFEVTLALAGGLPASVSVGHTATARVRISGAADQRLLPLDSLIRVGEEDFVVEQLAGGRLVPRRVTLGEEDHSHIEALSGISAGATVAVGDLTKIRQRLWPRE